MLDTNMASYVISGRPPEVRERLVALPMESIVISVVRQAELLYGLARKGHPAVLAKLIREVLLRVEVLLWDGHAATVYGELRASCAAAGIGLGALNMMIAAHAVAPTRRSSPMTKRSPAHLMAHSPSTIGPRAREARGGVGKEQATNPHFSLPIYCGRRSARCDEAYSLQPA